MTQVLERSHHYNTLQSVEKRARKRRVLTLVKLAHGRLTCPMARRLSGFNERMLQRYLNELAADGFVERHGRWPHDGATYTITAAGRVELGT